MVSFSSKSNILRAGFNYNMVLKLKYLVKCACAIEPIKKKNFKALDKQKNC